MVINGGILDLDQARGFLDHLEGVMIGRGVYQNPWLLARVDRDLFGDPRPLPDRHQILEDLIPYLEEGMAAGVPLQAMTRHILDLFQGQPGAKRWRRTLSENVHRPGAGIEHDCGIAHAMGQETIDRHPGPTLACIGAIGQARAGRLETKQPAA